MALAAGRGKGAEQINGNDWSSVLTSAALPMNYTLTSNAQPSTSYTAIPVNALQNHF